MLYQRPLRADHLKSHEFPTLPFETGDDVPDEAALDSIWLDSL